MKIVTVVGARPQFIKAAALSRYIRDVRPDAISETIVHTGQHYDQNMSDVFFEQMDIPHPTHRFDVDKGTHGAMTGKMLADIEELLMADRPDWLLVYGDTNSTLAGALAAAKLHIPVAHVEAGLRSFNKRMPEEINRILTDQVSTRLYCPTQTAVDNLHREGVRDGVVNPGDIMLDVAQHYGPRAEENSAILAELELASRGFALATIHRAENTDDPQRIREICQGLSKIATTLPVVLPLHPRTRKIVTQLGLDGLLANVRVIDPVPFWDILALLKNAELLVTDSGGMQKEAYFHAVPCITIRDETEWVETLNDGWNRLVAADEAAILKAVADAKRPTGAQAAYFGSGNTAELIVNDLLESI